MTVPQASPHIYQSAVPLNRDVHLGYTISPSPSGYCFAGSAQTVLMSTAEFFDACSEYPIIFSAAGSKGIVPLALLGLENGENLFVDDDGNWQGSYIPAYIRCYPFITADGKDGPMTVCFDETFDGFNREGGTSLFENNEPSPRLQEIAAFLKNYYVQVKETEAVCATLESAGLFRRIDAQANLVDGRSFAMNGMLVVDEQRLIQMLDVDIVRLFRSGLLPLIMAHLISLRHMGALMARKVNRERRGG